jgi:hypothetical protein
MSLFFALSAGSLYSSAAVSFESTQSTYCCSVTRKSC